LNKQTSISKQNWTDASLESLMGMLASLNGVIRQKARKSLVTLGKPAVLSLSEALQNSELDQVRWEAAKTLGAILDTRSVPSLVNALEDKDPDVAWLAAEALKKLKKAAWSTLLNVLIKRGSDSVSLRQGAYHVLRNQRENGFNDLLKTLIKTLELESRAVEESIVMAAYNILKQMELNS
jgi:HEAT repeat protein